VIGTELIVCVLSMIISSCGYFLCWFDIRTYQIYLEKRIVLFFTFIVDCGALAKMGSELEGME